MSHMPWGGPWGEGWAGEGAPPVTELKRWGVPVADRNIITGRTPDIASKTELVSRSPVEWILIFS